MPLFSENLVFDLCAAGFSATAANSVLNPRDFGVTGDGTTVDTAAIQKAIDWGGQQGGGVVAFPKGKYVCGTILLKDHVRLHLDKDAVLLGSTKIADYEKIDSSLSGNGAEMGFCLSARWAPRTRDWRKARGRLTGAGRSCCRWAARAAMPGRLFVRFVKCNGVTVSGIHLLSSAAWTMPFFQCTNVQAVHVTISSRGLANNDGMDVDWCSAVRIQDCDVDTATTRFVLKRRA